MFKFQKPYLYVPKSHFLKPVATFNSFRVRISGLLTQSKRFNPDKESQKYLKILVGLPTSP